MLVVPQRGNADVTDVIINCTALPKKLQQGSQGYRMVSFESARKIWSLLMSARLFVLAKFLKVLACSDFSLKFPPNLHLEN